MEVRALVVTNDPDAVALLRRVFGVVGLGMDLCPEPEDALRRVPTGRYEAIVVDCDAGTGGAALLKTLRAEPSCKSSIFFAVVTKSTSMRQAFDLGANFLLEKPLSLDRALRCFRAAYGLIQAERRRYYRHHLSIPVELDSTNIPVIHARSTNLSSSGMAIQVKGPLQTGATVRARFELPNAAERFDVTCLVLWVRNGQAGLHFSNLSNRTRGILLAWLGARMEEEEASKSNPGSRQRSSS